MFNKRAFAVLAVTACALASALAQFTGPAPLSWRWQQPSGSTPSGSPVVDGDTVYVTSGQRMYALNRADGNQKWRYPLGNPLDSYFHGSTVIGDGMVFATAGGSTIYAINKNTGQEVWHYITPGQVMGSPVFINHLVMFAANDGSIMAINAKDGQPFYTTPIQIKDGIQGSLNVWGNDVLVFDTNNTLFAINVGSEKVDWSRETEGVASDVYPVVDSDSVYFVSNNYLIGLGAATGQPRFSTSVDENLTTAPAVSPSGIMAVTREGKAYFFSTNGQLLSHTALDLGSGPVVRPTGLSSGLFVALTFSGNIELIDSKSGILWNYPIRPIGGPYAAPKPEAPAGGSGFGGGQGSLGGGGGQYGRGGPSQEVAMIDTVQAAGPAVGGGTTLLVFGRDSSLLAFDKESGVDLTPPDVKMTFPNPGDQVSGRPPLALVFKITDEATGVNPSTLKISADGMPLDYEFTNEGLAVVRFTLSGKNRVLTNGRKTITVDVADWVGNTSHTTYSLTIDDTLPPVVPPGTPPPKAGAGGPSAGKGGGGGAGGSSAGAG